MWELGVSELVTQVVRNLLLMNDMPETLTELTQMLLLALVTSVE